MKHLINDKGSSMTTELVSAELKIRLTSTLSCTELYKYLLGNEDLLRAIKSDEKYRFKKKFNSYIYLCNCFFFLILNNKY